MCRIEVVRNLRIPSMPPVAYHLTFVAKRFCRHMLGPRTSHLIVNQTPSEYLPKHSLPNFIC
tara:strand:- start:1619 stop:1804 length:186 start_codon:yes stop_codon:yes gene_type:complete